MKADPPSDDKTPSAGRPRDPRIDAAILGATADLLAEIGYANLTMAAVAERAGTTKTALYRRWSSKAELVHEAAFPTAPTALTKPEGDIVDDVRGMIAATRDVFVSPVVRAALPGLIADMAADADLNARVMSRFVGLFDLVRDRLAHAVERGDVHPDVDPERLIEIIGGATLLRLLLAPGRDLDESWVDQTTAIVIHGVRAGTGDHPPEPLRSADATEFTRRGLPRGSGRGGLLVAAGRSAVNGRVTDGFVIPDGIAAERGGVIRRCSRRRWPRAVWLLLCRDTAVNCSPRPARSCSWAPAMASSAASAGR